MVGRRTGNDSGRRAATTLVVAVVVAEDGSGHGANTYAGQSGTAAQLRATAAAPAVRFCRLTLGRAPVRRRRCRLRQRRYYCNAIGATATADA